MASAASALPLDIRKPQRTKRNNTRRIVKIKLELSLDRQQFANLFFGFIVKAKQPSPCELGCLLIVVFAGP
jgi:hypothetical protein